MAAARAARRGGAIPEEEVVGIGREAAVLEEPQQVVVLAMDVAHDLDGRLQLQQSGLLSETFRRLLDEEGDIVSRQVDRRAGLLCDRRAARYASHQFLCVSRSLVCLKVVAYSLSPRVAW